MILSSEVDHHSEESNKDGQAYRDKVGFFTISLTRSSHFSIISFRASTTATSQHISKVFTFHTSIFGKTHFDPGLGISGTFFTVTGIHFNPHVVITTHDSRE